MLVTLLLFPACAVLWMLLCNRLGLVEDQPLQEERVEPARVDLAQRDVFGGLREGQARPG